MIDRLSFIEEFADEPALRKFLPDAERRALAQDQWRTLVESPSNSVFELELLRNSALCVVAELPWDSQVLERRCHRMHFLAPSGAVIEGSSGQFFQQIMREADSDYLIARISAEESRLIGSLRLAHFETIDRLLQYGGVPTSDKSQELEELGEIHVDLAVALGREAFTDGRFLADPAISREQGSNAYGTWIRNSLLGTVGDAVLGILQSGRLAGFVTLGINRFVEKASGLKLSSIGLIAVDPAFRGQGFGLALVEGALAWSKNNGCDHMVVGTQLTNFAAQKLYLKAGLNVVNTETTMRLLPDG